MEGDKAIYVVKFLGSYLTEELTFSSNLLRLAVSVAILVERGIPDPRFTYVTKLLNGLTASLELF